MGTEALRLRPKHPQCCHVKMCGVITEIGTHQNQHCRAKDCLAIDMK